MGYSMYFWSAAISQDFEYNIPPHPPNSEPFKFLLPFVPRTKFEFEIIWNDQVYERQYLEEQQELFSHVLMLFHIFRIPP